MILFATFDRMKQHAGFFFLCSKSFHQSSVKTGEKPESVQTAITQTAYIH
ncbi:hypothetical protein HMPREF1981_00501 [Bacteroides pyogenes F0041]|uniref:Uncharacterized protein n=1 Tax=Bacteroides pyogenes F0041 TaxID=1321819 RepID=U2E2Z5_9BACE|nr:hypothetical protein [Bacteroides pyogenes]ERI88517.1 hypothetical protein HMPREF1981_00501 [Bacteroides pyogenes F0041]